MLTLKCYIEQPDAVWDQQVDVMGGGVSSDGDLILILLWYHFLVILSLLLGDAFSRSTFKMLSRKGTFIPFDENMVLNVSLED